MTINDGRRPNDNRMTAEGLMTMNDGRRPNDVPSCGIGPGGICSAFHRAERKKEKT